MQQRNNVRGFTLVELMVVITIIGILATIVSINVARALRDANVTTAKTQMRELKSAVEWHYRAKRRLPETLEDLVAGDEDERFFDSDEIPKDPWGGDYLYEKLDKRHFDIRSLGADGTEGGDGEDADIDLKSLNKTEGQDE